MKEKVCTREQQSLWFEAQTGRIEDQDWSSNFYHFELPSGARTFLEDAVNRASLGSGGLEYEPSFLRAVQVQSDKWTKRTSFNGRW